MSNYGIATYCDDIRQENTGKLLLIGVYSGEMFVSTAWPVRVNSLSASLNMRLDEGCIGQALTVQLHKDRTDEDRTEVLFDFQTTLPDVGPTLDAEPFPPAGEEPERHMLIQLNANFRDVPFDGPSRLRARAYVAGQTIRLGILQVRQNPEAPETTP